MGTTLGVRRGGRRQLWLVLALSLTAIIALPLLIPVPRDAGQDGTQGAAEEPTGEPQTSASGGEAAESSVPGDAGEQRTTDEGEEPETTDPVPPTTDDPPGDMPDALPEEVLMAFLALTDEVLTDPGDVDEEALSRLATGAALQDLRSMALEFSVTELRQAGQHDVVAIDVASSSTDEVSIDVCLDRTAVQLLQSDGAAVMVGEAAPRSLHNFVLRRSETRWQVAEHRFPEPDEC